MRIVNAKKYPSGTHYPFECSRKLKHRTNHLFLFVEFPTVYINIKSASFTYKLGYRGLIKNSLKLATKILLMLKR